MHDFWRPTPRAGWTTSGVVAEPISPADIARYAGASGDVNRVHVDDHFATAVAGHPSAIAHGMLTMGLTGSFLASLVGHEHIRRFGGRFLSPVVVGESLSCTATVRSVATDETDVEVEIDLETVTSAGDIAFRGQALARRKRVEGM